MRKTYLLTLFHKEIKVFWEGDITNAKMAWQLHCLVDKMDEWAIKTFRPSVLTFLKLWQAHLREAELAVHNPKLLR